MIKVKKSTYEYLLFALLFILVLLLFTNDYRLLSFNALSVWAVNVAPIVLPYLILTGLIKNLTLTKKLSKNLGILSSKVFKVSPNIHSALFVSLLCGLPVGLSEIANLKKDVAIGKVDSIKASILCSTPSPIFLIASYGRTMCNNVLIGLMVLSSNIISWFIISFIACRLGGSKTDTPKDVLPTKKRSLNPFYSTVWDSTVSVLYLGATLSTAYLFIELTYSLNLLTPFILLINNALKNEQISKGVIFGLIENTKGLSVISASELTLKGISACSFISAFGGLSVLMQSVIILKSAKIKTAPFLLSKFLSAVLSVFISYIILLIFG